MAMKLDVTFTGKKNGKDATRVLTIPDPITTLRGNLAEDFANFLLKDQIFLVGNEPATGISKIAYTDASTEVVLNKAPQKKQS